MDVMDELDDYDGALGVSHCPGRADRESWLLNSIITMSTDRLYQTAGVHSFGRPHTYDPTSFSIGNFLSLRQKSKQSAPPDVTLRRCHFELEHCCSSI